MMKKIFILLAHPPGDSFCKNLARQYQKGAKDAGHQVWIMNIFEMSFNPVLEHGYEKIQPLEPDLKKAQHIISQADILTFVYPIWWASTPAKLKGFFDRVILPGFAFKFHKKKLLPEQLLKGKGARLLASMDGPPFYYKWWLGEPGYKMMKANLNFCGIKPVKRYYFGSVKLSDEKKRAHWLEKAYKLGRTE